MALVYQEFASATAMYFEAGDEGDPMDIDAPRNRPAKYPEAWLDYILFHSRLDHMEVLAAGTTTINHSSVAPASTPSGMAAAFAWRGGEATHVLASYDDLGYVPVAIVAAEGNAVNGTPIQQGAVSSTRFATPIISATGLSIGEWSSIGADGLSATSITYTWLLIKRPDAPSGDLAKEFDPATGVLSFDRNRFRTDRRYLQIGGSLLAIPMGRSIDLKNGAARVWRADGTYYEPVPATAAMALLGHTTGSISYGASMAYNGSYADPGSIPVQAP